MQIIKDTAGREWSIALTIGTVKRLKAAGVFDMESIATHPQPMEALRPTIESPSAVASCWLVATTKERESRNVDEESFLDSFDGATVELARDALIREIIDFFPSRREVILEAMNRAKTIEAKQSANAIEKLRTATDEEILNMASAYGNQSMKPQAT